MAKKSDAPRLWSVWREVRDNGSRTSVRYSIGGSKLTYGQMVRMYEQLGAILQQNAADSQYESERVETQCTVRVETYETYNKYTSQPW